MLTKQAAVAVSLLCIIAVFRPCYSLKCYECDSFNVSTSENTEENCNDEFKTEPKNQQVECKQGDFSCGKIVISVNGDEMIKRECVGFHNILQCSSVDLVGDCFLCDTDGCNGSQTLECSLVVMIATTLIACLFYGLH